MANSRDKLDNGHNRTGSDALASNNDINGKSTGSSRMNSQDQLNEDAKSTKGESRDDLHDVSRRQNSEGSDRQTVPSIDTQSSNHHPHNGKTTKPLATGDSPRTSVSHHHHQPPSRHRKTTTNPSTPLEHIPHHDEKAAGDKNKLHSRWRWYYDARPVKGARLHSSAEHYESNLKVLYEFGTVRNHRSSYACNL